MKKIFIFLAALVTLFTYSNVQAGTFTFISSDMSINGSVGVLGFGDAFSNSSTTTPISGYIGNGFAFAECAATPTSVYTAGLTYGDPFESPGFLSTEAIVKTLFKPNFSGDGPEMSIGGSTNHGLDGYTVIQIYDVTAGGVPLWNYDFYPYSTIPHGKKTTYMNSFWTQNIILMAMKGRGEQP